MFDVIAVKYRQQDVHVTQFLKAIKFLEYISQRDSQLI